MDIQPLPIAPLPERPAAPSPESTSRPEVLPVAAEVAPLTAPADAGAAPVSLPSLPTPLPGQTVPPDGVTTPTVSGPPIADDVDVIEKEWVDKAKQIINATSADPYTEEEAIEDLQVDYLRKRYGKTIAKDPEQASNQEPG